ncbi:MAG: hypothetical protein KZQ73_07040 [Candidatus Thiodiazotropha sp. (ex Semelilucina semeliformis)]|nr:hypothetical protein [Candidatus Thiodiazotropha sp. (ex Myrtea spinifera)]MCU7807608.1 hypothetical protein [Candidatus Thiodiazotropha sp. (ex Semelilucina semeliformis)]MCU7810924.1 hypothetical protein [Candidatus Thiodiazotropha sp. (ex Notomyrtea botanica)]MCU7830898.1 hypothetical protein [Candidatus Thiodiazotropha sp. (ex Myrtea sp. 'scaly one' KF741663)]
MAILNCKRLRRVVMLAGVFLIVGMFLEVIAHQLSSSINLLFIQPVALGMVLASPVIILLTVAISLIPGLSLKDCVH